MASFLFSFEWWFDVEKVSKFKWKGNCSFKHFQHSLYLHFCLSSIHNEVSVALLEYKRATYADIFPGLVQAC